MRFKNEKLALLYFLCLFIQLEIHGDSDTCSQLYKYYSKDKNEVTGEINKCGD